MGYKRIALDIGGVIGPQLNQRLLEGGGYGMEPGLQPGTIEAVSKIVRHFARENCFIISRVSNAPKIRANMEWLNHWRFFELTGFAKANTIIYAGEREEKARLVGEHQITTMVDDRYQVLVGLPTNVELIAFNPDPVERAEHIQKLGDRRVTEVAGWPELLQYLGI